MKQKASRMVSFLLVFILFIQPLPVLSKYAKAGEVASLSIADGNIYITSTGYIQTTASSASGLTEIPFTGEYTIWGVNTKEYKIDISSGNHIINLTNLSTNGDILCKSTNGKVTFFIKNSVHFIKYGIHGGNNCSIELNGTGMYSASDILYLDNNATISTDNNSAVKTVDTITVNNLTMGTEQYTNSPDTYFGNGGYFIKKYSINNVSVDYNSPTDLDMRLISIPNTTTADGVYINNLDLKANKCNLVIGDQRTDVSITNSKFEINKLYNFLYACGKTTIDNTIIEGYYAAVGNAIIHNYGEDVVIRDSAILWKKPDESTKSSYVLFDGATTASSVTITNTSILSGNTTSNDNPNFYTNPTTENIVLDRAAVYSSTSNTTAKNNVINKYAEKLYPYSIKISGTPYQKCSVLVDDDYEGVPASLYTDESGILRLYLTLGTKEISVTTEDGSYFTYQGTVTADYSTQVKGTAELKNTVTITTPWISTPIQYSYDNNTWSNSSTGLIGDFTAVLPTGITRIYIRPAGSDALFYVEVVNGVPSIMEQAMPIVSDQSESQSVIKDSSVALYVDAQPFTNGNPLTYQWKKDGVDITDATNPVFHLKAVQDTDSGSYTCTINETNGGTTNSNPIVIQVIDNPYTGELANLQNQISDLQGQVTSLTTQLVNSQQEVVVLTTANNNLLTMIEDLNGQIIDLQQQIDVIIEDGHGETNLLLLQISQLTEQRDLLQQQLSDANTQIVNLQQEITDRNTTIKNLRIEINNLQTEYDDVEDENTSLRQQIAQLNIDMVNLHDQINDLVTETNTLNAEKTALTQQLSTADQRIADLYNQIALLQDSNQSLMDQLEAAEGTIGNLQSQLSNQISINTDLQTQMNQLNSDLEKANDQLNSANDDKNQLLAQISTLTSQLDELKNQLTNSSTSIDDLTNQINALTIVIDNLQAQINIALAELSGYEGDTLTQKIAAIKEKQKNVLDDLDDANGLNASLVNQLDTLNSQLIFLQSEVDRLTGVLTDQDAEIARLNNLLLESNTEMTNLTTQVSQLKAENEQLRNSSPGDTSELQNKITTLEKELTASKEFIKSLQEQVKNGSSGSNNGTSGGSNSGSNTSSTEVKDGEYVVVPKTSNSNDVETIVKDTVISGRNGTVESNVGWEISNSLAPDSTWGDKLVPDDNYYTGLFTFFDNGLSDRAIVETVKRNLAGITNFGIQLAGSDAAITKTFGNGYEKYTFYARKVNERNKVYICNVAVAKSEYLTPVTHVTSSVLKDPRTYTPVNTYTTIAEGKIKFHVSADFGAFGKESIAYQIVKEHVDFDPDGTWKMIQGNSFTIPKQNNNFRVYIKFTDKAGNYTVDKTVGFSVKSGVATDNSNHDMDPVFTMNKTIELGNVYNTYIANIGTKDKVSFYSEDSTIAMVNKDGIITAKKEGNTKVYGSIVSKDRNYTFVINVTVVKGVFRRTLSLKHLTFSKLYNAALAMYKLVDINGTVKLNTTGSDVSYTSSNQTIATVSKDGLITGKKKGFTTIYVTVTKDKIKYRYVVVLRVTDGTEDKDIDKYLYESKSE